MVMKITAWCHKVSSKMASHYTPDMFVKSQWQRSSGISIYYLVYRWVMASIFFSILIASLIGVGRPGGNFYYYTKWVIYLTHWGFTICTLQALLAAYLVTRAHCKYSEHEAEAIKMDRSLRIYWAMHSCATVGAFSITIIYWCFVFDPDEHPLDVLNVLVHAGNTILMLTDLIVISHPIRLVDFYWPVAFALTYSVFNFFYYLTGGTDRKGRTYIYKILDWQKPGQTLLVLQGCILFTLMVHLSVCLFCLLRCKIAEVLRRCAVDRRDDRAQNLQGVTNEIPINDYV